MHQLISSVPLMCVYGTGHDVKRRWAVILLETKPRLKLDDAS
jgi:hypothetical protein